MSLKDRKVIYVVNEIFCINDMGDGETLVYSTYEKAIKTVLGFLEGHEIDCEELSNDVQVWRECNAISTGSKYSIKKCYLDY